MKFSLKLVEKDNEIQSLISKSLLSQLDNFLINLIPKLKSGLSVIITRSIVSSPEYNSLLSGELQYNFGINDSNNKLNELLNIWANNINIEYTAPKLSNNKIVSKLLASMIRIDFADVLYTDYALVIDSMRGYSLPWLEWLLLEGNKSIIQDYEIVVGTNNRSRTGMAIMRSSYGDSWKVPSQYAGTQNDNWITRAIDTIGDDVDKLLESLLK